jgi:hypothetical protein
MWTAADKSDPGAIPPEDKTSMISEYQCLYGISTQVNKMPAGWADVTFAKDKSSLCITGKGGRFYFFIFKKLDKVYQYPNVPRYNTEDAAHFAESMFDLPIHNKEGPVGAMTFKDVWEKRVSFTLVALEEAEYKRWTWGRFAILGDGIHKMTPNAGAGGNNAIESAAVLANVLYDLQHSTQGRHPSLQEIETALTTYHKTRETRTTAAVAVANKLTRMQALKGLDDRIMSLYVVPLLGADFIMELQADLAIGAEVLQYLPMPIRSLESNMPFNPEQGVGKKESTLLRVLLALPFVGLTVFAARNLSPSTEALHSIEKEFRNVQLWDLKALPFVHDLLESDWPSGRLWRLVAFFTQWNAASESSSAWQLPSFLADYGVLYTILLIESVRRANGLNIFAH